MRLAFAAWLALGLILGRCFEYERIAGTEGAARQIPSHSSLAAEVDAIGLPGDVEVRLLALLAAQYVARRLHYDYRGARGVDMSDPVSIYRHRAVNCQGYSVLFGAVLTRLLDRADLRIRYEVKTASGYVFFLGRQVLLRPYFTSHVYNIVYRLEGDRSSLAYVVDSNLYDYTGILFVQDRGPSVSQ